MFNNLNNESNGGHNAVDDIFAETDKTNVSVAPNNIEIHHVGLTSDIENLKFSKNEENVSAPSPVNKNYLRIIIIVVLLLAVSAGAYFSYLQFFSGTEKTEVAKTPKVDTPAPVISKTEDNNFVSVIPGVGSSTATTSVDITPSSTLVVDNETILGQSSTTEEIKETIDSDGDGLSDDEELLAKTNLNVIDTDNDGLSDYEELRIYLTNPILADTDGDSYLDGVEIKGGYDPKVKGAKLPGNN